MKNLKKDLLPDIERSIIIEAPIQKVWDAISTSEGLASWLMPNTFKAELGYEFIFKAKPMGNWDGTVNCKVMELNPPERLGMTWNGNNMEQYVSFELVPMNINTTQFLLVHTGWTEEHAKLREMMYDGWGYLTEDLSKKLGEKNGGYLS